MSRSSLISRLARRLSLQTLIEQQRDPESPNYQNGLCRTICGRFGMSQSDFDKVASMASIARIYGGPYFPQPNGDFFQRKRGPNRIGVPDRVSSIQCGWETHLANVTEPSVPAALSGAVMGFWKMNDFRWKPRAAVKGVSPRFNNGRIHSSLLPTSRRSITSTLLQRRF